MKKIVLSILIYLTASCAFAKTITVESKKTKIQETVAWQVDKQDDGWIFLLGPQSDHSILIQVNKYLSTGLPADAITVRCNGTRNRVEPTQSITCYGNYKDVMSFDVNPQDFKNGSAGTYTFIPLNQ